MLITTQVISKGFSIILNLQQSIYLQLFDKNTEFENWSYFHLLNDLLIVVSNDA